MARFADTVVLEYGGWGVCEPAGTTQASSAHSPTTVRLLHFLLPPLLLLLLLLLVLSQFG